MKFLVKTFFIILLIFAVNIPINTVRGRAKSDNYMRITTQITPFFQDAETTDLLFYLPYTYYVNVLEVKGNVAHVEYGEPAIDGYTYFDMLFSDNLDTENPFPDLYLTTLKTTTLYKDVNLKSPILFVFAERKLKFYGRIEQDNQFLYFVEYNGKIGYVLEDDIYPFTLLNHPNPLTFLPEDPPTTNVPSLNKVTALTPIRIIIISCLLLAGIIGIFISIKNKKSPSFKGDYYEEKDYE